MNDSPAIVQILRARRQALSKPLPTQVETPKKHQPQPDPFAHESHSFFISPLPLPTPPSPPSSPGSADAPADVPAGPTDRPSSPVRPPATVPRGRRAVANWTPEMDRAVRRALAKHGWGCWSKIASSGKLPEQYTRKMISNRAKALGLTREMFGPAITKP